MIFHVNSLLADDSHKISYLIFFQKITNDVAKFVFCCSCDWSFMGEFRNFEGLKAVNCSFNALNCSFNAKCITQPLEAAEF